MTTAPESIDAGPFDLGDPGDAAVLCLHGLTGTPYEVRPVAEAMAAAGFRARGPALPGHLSTPESLAVTPWSAWVEAAREELAALRATHARVFLVGMSMGGLVSLKLAAEERVDGLAVIGTPLRLRRPVPQLVWLARHLRRFVRKPGGSDIQDAAARARHPSYDLMPVASVHQLVKLQARVRPLLSRVSAPLLVAHGALDATADPQDALEIEASVSSASCERIELARSGHIVPVDHDGPELCAAITAFLGRHS
jgi:carboxylesterase